MSNTAIICLGANAYNKQQALEAATQFVSTLGIITADSNNFISEPEPATQQSVPYLNRIIKISTALSQQSLVTLSKKYESEIRAKHIHPTIAVDIDIVNFNGTILRQKDTSSTYYQKGLILAGISNE